MGNSRALRLLCWVLHKKHHVREPGGMHCYACHCARCGREWLQFE